jgi:7-cyano-7-deazaguanine synthase
MVKKAVCLLSGGIDSCVTAYLAKQAGYSIYGLTFRYGQRHEKEIECAKKIASAAHAADHVIFDIDLAQFRGSSLTDTKIPLQDHRFDEIGQSIPSTYVPGRNTVFLSIGLAYAESIDAEALFIGVTATDYAGYPDCRPAYIDAFQKMTNLATRKSVEGTPTKIKVPLLNMSKNDIIKTGVTLYAPLHNTWSCYRGGEKACGRCDSCLLRLKGFKEAGVKDPLPYDTVPEWYP